MPNSKAIISGDQFARAVKGSCPTNQPVCIQNIVIGSLRMFSGVNLPYKLPRRRPPF
jgi:hypothetical protein